MTAASLTAIIINFALTILCGFISARQFAEKGFLFNNSCLFASKEERADMNKKPYYRQSAVVFCLLSAVFCVSGLSVVFQIEKLLLLEIPVVVGTVIYAAASSVKIEKITKR